MWRIVLKQVSNVQDVEIILSAIQLPHFREIWQELMKADLCAGLLLLGMR